MGRYGWRGWERQKGNRRRMHKTRNMHNREKDEVFEFTDKSLKM